MKPAIPGYQDDDHYLVREYILSAEVQLLIIQLPSLSDLAEALARQRILDDAPFFGDFQDRTSVGIESVL